VTDELVSVGGAGKRPAEPVDRGAAVARSAVGNRLDTAFGRAVDRLVRRVQEPAVCRANGSGEPQCNPTHLVVY
jgi:hypothetical protein